MARTFDCIVLGVGGFGSGALHHLARRGLSCLGIERFDVAHQRGSSHGETRIIRKAYFEHPDYVPLLFRAYDLWAELEQESKRRLYHQCGLFLAGPPDGEAVAGAKQSARLYGVKLDELSPRDAERRFPGFHFAAEFGVVYEPEAGYLEVENCVRTHIERAVARGAELHTSETVVSWSAAANGIRVTTDRDTYEAAKLIVTAGAWSSQMLRALHIPLQVVRKPQFWFDVKSRDYDESGGASAWLFEIPNKTHGQPSVGLGGVFYGFPSVNGQTIKAAEHTRGDPVDDPLHLDRACHPEDYRALANFLQQHVVGVRSEPARHSVCMYTHTPDRHFIIDRHPEHPQVVIGAGFSGHGFKFTSVLGQALADLAIDGRTDLPIGFLSLKRPALNSQ